MNRMNLKASLALLIVGTGLVALYPGHGSASGVAAAPPLRIVLERAGGPPREISERHPPQLSEERRPPLGEGPRRRQRDLGHGDEAPVDRRVDLVGREVGVGRENPQRARRDRVPRLVAALGDELKKLPLAVNADPKVNRSLFRWKDTGAQCPNRVAGGHSTQPRSR